MMTILLVILIVLLVGGGFGYTGGWHTNYPGAYWGGGGLGLIRLVILIVVLLRGGL